MKYGFTLVELSISLVIIGLLVGGILIGQSLIESARMSAFIKQMQQIDSAVALFNDKYKSLPGDNDLTRVAIRLTSGAMTPTKNDRILCDDDCQGGNTFTTNTEAHNFWYDLNVLGGVKFDNCPKLSTQSGVRELIASGARCNMPTAKLGEKAFIFVNYTSNNRALNRNYYGMADCSLMQKVSNPGGFWNGAYGGGGC